MVWRLKLAALLFFSIGLGLLFLPFPGQLVGERSREVVYLEILPAPLHKEEAVERFGEDYVSFSYDGLAEYPEFRDAVLGLMGRSDGRCISEREWKGLLVSLERQVGVGMVYSFREGIYRVVETAAIVDQGSHLMCFEVTLLGAYDDPGKAQFNYFRPADLQRYPVLQAEVERLSSRPVPLTEAVAVTPREWLKFQRRMLDSDSFNPAFVVEKRLVRGWTTDELVPYSIEVPWLRPVTLFGGGIALLLGSWLFYRSYRVILPSGIPVAPIWLSLFCDMILLVGSAIFIPLFLDCLWVSLLGQSSLLGLEPDWPSEQKITGLHFVSIPATFVALPLLSLWFTSLSSQRVFVDVSGVTLSGAIGSRSLAWEKLEHVQVREQRNPFSFTVVDFRGLQKVLDLVGTQEVLTINEPSSRKRKEAIVNAIKAHVPEWLDSRLAGLEQW